MRNFKFIGSAALVMGLGAASMMTSCSNEKDLYDPVKVVENKKAEYAEAFRQMFGEIAADNDWGFGKSTRAVMTRAGEEAYVFGSDDASVYQTSMPEGLPVINEYATVGWDAEAGVSIVNHPAFYLPEGTTTVNAWAGNCEIYIPDGEYAIGEWHTGVNTKVYLLPGAHVTFTGSLNENYTGNVWSVPAGASITVNGSLTYNFKIYNRGTVKTGKFQLYANSFVCTSGILETGEFIIANNNCEVINAGELTSTSVKVEGSGHFCNIGKATVNGETVVNSNSCTWYNNGEYTTDNFTYNAGSHDVMNGCMLTVNNKFKMVLGDGEHDTKVFKVGKESSVVTKDFEMGIGYIDMGEKSVFRVTGTALMGITKADYGIYGVGVDYAVFEAKEIKGGTVGQWYSAEGTNGYMATYGGNLYVATDSHFAQGYSGTYPYYDMKGAAVLCDGGVATAPINIPETDCCAGYAGTGETEPDVVGWRVFAEDLGAIGDFDFNDVVFDVIQHVADNKTEIKVVAAGGTMPLSVAGREVHALFNVTTNTMINTGNGAQNGKEPQSFELDGLLTPADIEIAVVNGDITYTITAEMGVAPGKICVPLTTVDWSAETVNIKATYPKFADYVGNPAIEWWVK